MRQRLWAGGVVAGLLVGLVVTQIVLQEYHRNDAWCLVGTFLGQTQLNTDALTEANAVWQRGSTRVQGTDSRFPPTVKFAQEQLNGGRQFIEVPGDPETVRWVDGKGGEVFLHVSNGAWILSTYVPPTLPTLGGANQGWVGAVTLVRRVCYVGLYGAWLLVAMALWARHQRWSEAVRKRVGIYLVVIAGAATVLALSGPTYWRAWHSLGEEDSAGWGVVMLGVSGLVVRKQREGRVDAVPRCEECGYNLTGNVSGRCPECGKVKGCDETGQWERYTDRARGAMVLANQMALEEGAAGILPEHLLAALVEKKDGVGIALLKFVDVAVGDLRPSEVVLRKEIGAGEVRKLPLEDAMKGVVWRAIDAATRLADDYVGTEHLVIGMAEAGVPAMVGALAAAGVKPGTLGDYLFVYRRLGEALAAQQAGKWKDVRDAYRRILALMPEYRLAANNLAWLLATCPEDSIRSGERALALMQWVATETETQKWFQVGTLAAAYAE